MFIVCSVLVHQFAGRTRALAGHLQSACCIERRAVSPTPDVKRAIDLKLESPDPSITDLPQLDEKGGSRPARLIQR